MSVSHPDPDRLVLAALPAERPDPEIVEHLTECAQCRDHVGALSRTVDLARIGHADPVASPPPRVWQAITDELGEPPDVAEPHLDHRPVPEPPTRSWWRVAGLPIAAAVAGVAAGLAIGLAVSTPTAPPAVPAPPAVTLLARLLPIGELDPAAAGTVDGVARAGAQDLVIRVDGVTDTAQGDYLEAWLLDPAGTRLVSLGALTRTADGTYHGEFAVPADLPMATFTTVDISAERWDGDPTHSRISLLRGSMT